MIDPEGLVTTTLSINGSVRTATVANDASWLVAVVLEHHDDSERGGVGTLSFHCWAATGCHIAL